MFRQLSFSTRPASTDGTSTSKAHKGSALRTSDLTKPVSLCGLGTSPHCTDSTAQFSALDALLGKTWVRQPDPMNCYCGLQPRQRRRTRTAVSITASQNDFHPLRSVQPNILTADMWGATRRVSPSPFSFGYKTLPRLPSICAAPLWSW